MPHTPEDRGATVIRVAGGLFVALILACTTQRDPVDPCPVGSPSWVELESLPDSLRVPPSFFFEQPTVPVEHLVACQHGIFFNFHAPDDSVSTEYWISFPVPTYAEYEKYYLEQQIGSVFPVVDPDSIRYAVETRLSSAASSYQRLKQELQSVLGKRFVEQHSIDLSGTPAQLRLEFPLVFVWEEQSTPFATYPGIYQRRDGRSTR